MTHLIFDSGPLINFSMNGLLPLLKKLKKEFKGDFLITKEIKQEIIETPLSIKKYELGALQLKELYDEGIIKLADITKEQVDLLREKRNEITSVANTLFKIKNDYVHLIDKGESAILALSSILKEPNVIVVDERTTRMLCENPENLKKLMQKKLKANIKANRENYRFFKNFKVIRSTELIYIAHKKKIIEIKDARAYEAMLYGMKYHGCSISEEEIHEMKRL